MFLATTALQEFWQREGKILFLSSWCLKYADRDEWRKLDLEVLPYPWDESARLEKAYCELRELYDQCLKSLSEWLNETHGLNCDLRYWNIIIGFWLLHFLSVVQDRYACVNDAIRFDPALHTIGLDRNSYVVPKNNLDFVDMCADDPFNLQIITEIVDFLGIPHSRRSANVAYQKEPTPHRVRDSVADVLHRLSRVKTTQLYAAFPWQSRLRLGLHSHFRQWPSFLPHDRSQSMQVPVDEKKRSSLTELMRSSEIEKIISHVLPWALPLAYLEGFSDLREPTSRGSRATVIASDNGFHYNETFKIYAAESYRRGAKLIALQHGGGYGIFRQMPIEQYELSICDEFWSWGWYAPSVRPVPAAKLTGLRESGPELFQPKNKDILFVATLQPRYLVRFHSNHLGPQVGDYLDWAARFIKRIDPGLRNKLIYRPYMYDYGWNVIERLKEMDPSLRIDTGQRRFHQALRESKLVVIDNNETTFLEALVANKPLILFWNPERRQIRDTAQPFFDSLRQAGILHDSPESAAEMVARVYEKPDTWWNSEPVQSTRQVMINAFAFYTPDWPSQWCSALASVK